MKLQCLEMCIGGEIIVLRSKEVTTLSQASVTLGNKGRNYKQGDFFLGVGGVYFLIWQVVTRVFTL